MNLLPRFLMDHLENALAAHAGRDAHAPANGQDFQNSYADYANAVAKASAMLQQHGPGSAQFRDADIAGMRLFHRVKKMQGLKKPART